MRFGGCDGLPSQPGHADATAMISQIFLIIFTFLQILNKKRTYRKNAG